MRRAGVGSLQFAFSPETSHIAARFPASFAVAQLRVRRSSQCHVLASIPFWRSHPIDTTMHTSLRPFFLFGSTVCWLAACGGGGGGGGAATSTISGQVRVPELAPAALARSEFADWQRPMLPGEVVVWLEPGHAPEQLATDGFDLVRSGGSIAVYSAQAAQGKSSLRDGATADQSSERATSDAAVAMGDRPGVRCATPNFLLQRCITPNDTFFAKQWHYPQINLPQARDLTQGSSSVIVAVLDTGIVSAHPDFAGRFVNGYDMISSAAAARDGNGRDANPEDVGDLATPQGSSFHGTHVAGTIGANGNDGVGVAGVDWNCKLMIVRVLGQGGGSVDDIANGILFAAGLANGSGQVPPQRADVINMSLGGPGLNAVLEQACDAAAAAGVLLVAAAGNDNSSQPNSPAAFASVLSVGAVDLLRSRAPYSNFSSTVDIWAPGGDMGVDRNGDGHPDGVLSCMSDDAGALFFAFENGTSMASPHVAGVAALVKAANPALTASQIRSILTATAVNGNGLPNSGKLVDALAAVQSAQGGGASVPLLVSTPSAIDFGDSATTSALGLENRGNGNLVFDNFSFQPAAPWFSGLLSDVTPANGIDLDSMAITIDRTGLANGVYQTRMTLNYLDMATMVSVDVEIRIQVGASPVSADTVFVLLVDPITLESLFETSTTAGSSFAFAMAGVAAGDYLLVAGTDRDNDNILGDDGELFGAWPSLDVPQAITITAGVNSSDLEFGMEDFVAVQSTGTTPRPTFRRKS